MVVVILDGFGEGKPWLPTGPDHVALAVDCQGEGSLLAWTRTVLALRKAEAALRLGTIRFTRADTQVLEFEREHAGERLRCVFNLSPEPAEYAAPAAEPLLACGDGDLQRIGSYAAAVFRVG